MANRTIRLPLAISLLLAASLACLFTPSAEPDTVATGVAGTMAVLEATEPPPSPPPPTESPLLAPTWTGEPVPATIPSLHVAYLKDGNAWYWELGEAPLQLTFTGDVVEALLSDDSAQVAFVRQIDSSRQALWAVNTDGTWTHGLFAESDFDRLTSDEGIATVPSQLDWVAGEPLLLMSTREILEGPGEGNNFDLWWVDSGEPPVVVSLLEPGEGGEFTPSRDGSRIAFATAEQIFVTDQRGGGRIDLHTFSPLMTESEWRYFPPVTWTLGSDALRVPIPPENPRADPYALTRLYHLPLSGSPSIAAGFSSVPVFESEVTLSPDGQLAAYISTFSPPHDKALRIWSEPAGEEYLYDTGEVAFLAWSPDNRHFLYTRDGAPHLGQIGEDTVPLTGIDTMHNAVFADPARYLYLTKNGSRWELWLGDLDGTQFLIAESGEWIRYDFVR